MAAAPGAGGEEEAASAEEEAASEEEEAASGEEESAITEKEAESAEEEAASEEEAAFFRGTFPGLSFVFASRMCAAAFQSWMKEDLRRTRCTARTKEVGREDFLAAEEVGREDSLGAEDVGTAV